MFAYLPTAVCLLPTDFLIRVYLRKSAANRACFKSVKSV